MTPVPCPRHLNVAAEWRADIQTARTDLDATPTQAVVLAVHAFAWRLVPLTLPVAVAVAGGFVLAGDARLFVLLIALGIGVFGPVLAASPLAGVAAWSHSSRNARMPFGGVSFFYPYYGFRYAYRGRRRDWSSMTRRERVLANPKRAEWM